MDYLGWAALCLVLALLLADRLLIHRARLRERRRRERLREREQRLHEDWAARGLPPRS